MEHLREVMFLLWCLLFSIVGWPEGRLFSRNLPVRRLRPTVLPDCRLSLRRRMVLVILNVLWAWLGDWGFVVMFFGLE
jgi:hypothetical protein